MVARAGGKADYASIPAAASPPLSKSRLTLGFLLVALALVRRARVLDAHAATTACSPRVAPRTRSRGSGRRVAVKRSSSNIFRAPTSEGEPSWRTYTSAEEPGPASQVCAAFSWSPTGLARLRGATELVKSVPPLKIPYAGKDCSNNAVDPHAPWGTNQDFCSGHGLDGRALAFVPCVCIRSI